MTVDPNIMMFGPNIWLDLGLGDGFYGSIQIPHTGPDSNFSRISYINGTFQFTAWETPQSGQSWPDISMDLQISREGNQELESTFRPFVEDIKARYKEGTMIRSRAR